MEAFFHAHEENLCDEANTDRGHDAQCQCTDELIVIHKVLLEGVDHHDGFILLGLGIVNKIHVDKLLHLETGANNVFDHFRE